MLSVSQPHRFAAYGWPVEIYDLPYPGYEGAILAVYLAGGRVHSARVLDVDEARHVSYRRTVRVCDSDLARLRLHRPQDSAPDHVEPGSSTMWALAWLGADVMGTVGPYVEPAPPRAKGSRR
jgi:hypothetical protein